MISPGKKTKPISIKTGPWPQLATDNMPIILAVLTKIPGKSVIEETIFSNNLIKKIGEYYKDIKLKWSRLVQFEENEPKTFQDIINLIKK